LAYTKSLINLKNFGSTFGLGGQLPPLPPLATRLLLSKAEITISRETDQQEKWRWSGIAFTVFNITDFYEDKMYHKNLRRLVNWRQKWQLKPGKFPKRNAFASLTIMSKVQHMQI